MEKNGIEVFFLLRTDKGVEKFVSITRLFACACCAGLINETNHFEKGIVENTRNWLTVREAIGSITIDNFLTNNHSDDHTRNDHSVRYIVVDN